MSYLEIRQYWYQYEPDWYRTEEYTAPTNYYEFWWYKQWIACPKCGLSRESAWTYCPYCGKRLYDKCCCNQYYPDNYKFCPRCGKELK